MYLLAYGSGNFSIFELSQRQCDGDGSKKYYDVSCLSTRFTYRIKCTIVAKPSIRSLCHSNQTKVSTLKNFLTKRLKSFYNDIISLDSSSENFIRFISIFLLFRMKFFFVWHASVKNNKYHQSHNILYLKKMKRDKHGRNTNLMHGYLVARMRF